MAAGLSLLDYTQCIKYAFIEESRMLRTGTTLALEVAVLDGAATGAITDSITDCDGVRNINIHAAVGADTLGTAASATVQYSPSDVDDVWIDAGLTLASDTAANGVTTGTPVTSLLARRIRVVLDTAPVSGDVTFYVIGS